MSTFEVVRGAEGDCLLLDDTRISGPKPWGGGAVTKTFHTDKAYAVVPKDEIDRLKAENAKLRELLSGYADSFERDAAMNGGNGPYYSGEDWLSLANDMRFDLAEACGELGVDE